MKVKEVRKKTEGELQKMLKSQREVMRDLRFKISSKQHKDVRDYREVKQTIARILTVLKEKKVLSKIKAVNKKDINLK
ncbi:50S ribosomal protein L29 [Patescibacteria group bacterium]|nr:50S ribosomal protein L29 [Patescibacteria group bacterium]MBU0963776.1 50S ribosomal protein L29 [Patescibacteria group bacterium]